MVTPELCLLDMRHACYMEKVPCFSLRYNYNISWLQVPSYVMLGIPKHDEAPATPQRPLSPMGEACSRMDLTAIHQILVTTHYRDDEGTNEVSSTRCLAFACHEIYIGNFTLISCVFSYPSKSGLSR